jgi:hypothetical protein
LTVDTSHTCAPARNTNSPVEERALRDQLALLRARYDHGTIPSAIFAVIREIEVELAWLEHRGEAAP